MSTKSARVILSERQRVEGSQRRSLYNRRRLRFLPKGLGASLEMTYDWVCLQSEKPLRKERFFHALFTAASGR